MSLIRSLAHSPATTLSTVTVAQKLQFSFLRREDPREQSFPVLPPLPAPRPPPCLWALLCSLSCNSGCSSHFYTNPRALTPASGHRSSTGRSIYLSHLSLPSLPGHSHRHRNSFSYLHPKSPRPPPAPSHPHFSFPPLAKTASKGLSLLLLFKSLGPVLS